MDAERPVVARHSGFDAAPLRPDYHWLLSTPEGATRPTSRTCCGARSAPI